MCVCVEPYLSYAIRLYGIILNSYSHINSQKTHLFNISVNICVIQRRMEVLFASPFLLTTVLCKAVTSGWNGGHPIVFQPAWDKYISPLSSVWEWAGIEFRSRLSFTSPAARTVHNICIGPATGIITLVPQHHCNLCLGTFYKSKRRVVFLRFVHVTKDVILQKVFIK